MVRTMMSSHRRRRGAEVGAHRRQCERRRPKRFARRETKDARAPSRRVRFELRRRGTGPSSAAGRSPNVRLGVTGEPNVCDIARSASQE